MSIALAKQRTFLIKVEFKCFQILSGIAFQKKMGSFDIKRGQNLNRQISDEKILYIVIVSKQ